MKASNLWLLVFAVMHIFVAEAVCAPVGVIVVVFCSFFSLLCVCLYTGRATAVCALGVVGSVAALRLGTLDRPIRPSIDADAVLFRCTVETPSVRRCRDGASWCTHDTQVSLKAYAHGSGWQPAQGRVLAGLWELGGPVARGDRLIVRLSIDTKIPPSAPWQPSVEAMAQKRGAYSCAQVRGVHVIEQAALGLVARIDRMRAYLAACLDSALPQPHAAVARALTLGDQAGLTAHQRDSWAEAGLAHLLAISGLHVSLVARGVLACFTWALGCLRLKERACLLAYGLAILAVWGYVVLAGLPIAAARAACMASVALVAPIFGRSSASAQVLGATGLVLIALSPRAALSPGFLLSFISVACLLAVPSQPVPSPSAPSLRTRMAACFAYVRLNFTSSLVATVGTAPLGIIFFHQFAWVGPLANLFAIPLGAMLITPLALVTVALTPWPAAYSPATQALGALLEVLHRWVGACARLGGGAWYVFDWLVSDALAWAALMGAGWLRLARPAYRQSFYLLAASCACFVACSAGLRHADTAFDGRLTLYHLDVGQGDATLVRADNGSYVLIDGGGALYAGQSDPGRHAVAPALGYFGVRRLEAVLITHAHPDHMAGLQYVLTRWPCRHLWRSEHAAQSPGVRHLERLVKDRGGQVSLPPAGLHLGKTTFTFFAPLADEQASANDHSTVTHVQMGNSTALLLGDIETRAEAWLALRVGSVDLIKVAHHGSRTSSSQKLLEATSPGLAVISCGRRNRFGFPHTEVMTRLAQHKVEVYRTDTMGNLEFSTQGDSWSVRTVQHAKKRSSKGVK